MASRCFFRRGSETRAHRPRPRGERQTRCRRDRPGSWRQSGRAGPPACVRQSRSSLDDRSREPLAAAAPSGRQRCCRQSGATGGAASYTPGPGGRFILAPQIPGDSYAAVGTPATKIATFNVNGINGRLPRLLEWLDESRPDVACLQEIKTSGDCVPAAAIAAAVTSALEGTAFAPRRGHARSGSRASGTPPRPAGR